MILVEGVEVEFLVLGPVEVLVGARVVAVERPQQRLLAAALAVDAGRPVMVETLIDRLWDEAPAGARRTLHVLITQLRRALERAGTADEGAPVVRHAGGYVLDVEPERVDLLRFRSLLAQARNLGDSDAGRLMLLREALRLWRGEPLAGLGGQWAARTRQALRQEHLAVVVSWAQAELDNGDPATVVGPLTGLINEHPFVESLVEVLMRVLCATGRSADALTLYADTRQRLADELGADPGAALQGLHQQILRGELDRVRTATVVETAVPEVPRQLPASVAYFAGRSAELAALAGLLAGRADTGGTVVISAVSGTAGVGKTALAVHWAHQVVDQFPDGQLYVNLRGFDPSGSVMEPAEAIRRFLDALGVPPEWIPVDLDAQATLYRSQLAGKRMVVVLDNARDTAQIRSLLPGASTCLVLITSRNQLTSLIATEAAHPIILDLLTDEEARQLLAGRLGPGRMAAEPAAVAEIITRCAHLPLALALVAARAALQPHTGLHRLADELRSTQHRWQTLTGDDPATDVRAVLSWSYQALTPAVARLFRQLGLHPGPDIATPAAASLAGLPTSTIRPQLTELSQASLLVEHTPGRYSFHDLLRAYAFDLVQRIDTDQQRHAATHRLLDHYLHTAHAAERLLNPARDPIILIPPASGVILEPPADDRQALDWFTVERPVVLAIVEHAVANDIDTHTGQLAWTLETFLNRRGHWHDLVAVGGAEVAAAHRLADPATLARAHRTLARAHMLLGRLDDAHTQFSHALDLATQIGDDTGQAHTHHFLSYLWEQRKDYPQARDHARQALALYQTTGHQNGQAIALNDVGWCHALLGDYWQARTACQQALTLHQELSNRDGQANTWNSLGYVHHHLGHHTDALTYYQQALALRRDLGDRYGEAITLADLGDTHHATGELNAARDVWQQAFTILDELQHADAEQVRAKLNSLGTPSSRLLDAGH